MSLLVSVVIPTWNRKDTLAHVLPKLANQTLAADRYEILVCDSGSTDGTQEMVRSLALPHIRLVNNTRGNSRSGARNSGILAAQGELILFTDADILPDENLLQQHVDMHAKHGNAAVVGLEVQVDHLAEYEAVRMNPYDFGRHMHGRTEKQMSWLFFLTGNASADRKALMEIGLFDENFSAYGHEDLELGYRLRKSGRRIFYHPQAVNYHWHPVSFAERCDKMRASGMATRRFYEKHRDWSVLLRLGINPASLGLYSLISRCTSWKNKLASKTMETGFGRELTLQYHYLSGYCEAAH